MKDRVRRVPREPWAVTEDKVRRVVGDNKEHYARGMA